MANPSADTIPGRFEVKATALVYFAWLRTRLSVERTMMSWVRTGTALIAFGFTTGQFFDRTTDAGRARSIARHLRWSPAVKSRQHLTAVNPCKIEPFRATLC